MGAVGLEILIILGLILANGLLAMAEIAIVSARKARLEQRADRGSRGARVALELADDPNRTLSTVQIGITLIGILAGTFGGATLSERLAGLLDDIPALARYSQAISVVVVVAVITYLSLVLGELVPKRLGLNDAERVALTVARPMRTLSVLSAPVVALLSFSTDVVLRVLGVGPSNEPLVMEEEVTSLLEQATQAGVFEEAEQDIVTRVFRLGDQRVDALMTPRTEIEWLDLEDPPEEIRHRVATSPHSRFPVAQESLDHMLGVVRARDLMARALAGQPFDLRQALQTPLFVPETMPALEVLESFKQTRTQCAFVIDEYGGLEGMVTVNDILDALVGDIPLAEDRDEPQIVQREDGSWLIDGLLPVDELTELLHLDELPGEERGDYQTLGGFVMSSLGRVPSTADHFEYEGLRFEVMDMDGNRVDKVLVVHLQEQSGG